MVTPDGSLSGYTNHFDQDRLEKELESIISESAGSGVGLMLGTCFREKDAGQEFCYNQVRVYDQGGHLMGEYSEILRCSPLDNPGTGEMTDCVEGRLRTFEWKGTMFGILRYRGTVPCTKNFPFRQGKRRLNEPYQYFAMKKTLFFLMILTTGILSFAFLHENERGGKQVIANKTVTQVAIVVKDIDKTRKAWAEILGVDAPVVSVAESHPSRPTRYHGDLTDAEAKLAFLDMVNLQIELIQPLGGKSTWQEFLDKNGEGIHHIAFSVKDINGMEKKFEMKGMPTIQNGGWDGGAYSYIDAGQSLGCILELLENYK